MMDFIQYIIELKYPLTQIIAIIFMSLCFECFKKQKILLAIIFLILTILMFLVTFYLFYLDDRWRFETTEKERRTGDGKIIIQYNGKINLDSINEFYLENYNKAYEDLIYFNGDFSNSVDYANKLKTSSYNFIFNNCMQVSSDVWKTGDGSLS